MRGATAVLLFLNFFVQGCESKPIDRQAQFQEWRQQSDWEVESRTRARLVDPSELKEVLVGKSRLEIYALLGQPDVDNSTSEITYKLGTDPNFGIDFWELRLAFDSADLVSTVAIDSY